MTKEEKEMRIYGKVLENIIRSIQYAAVKKDKAALDESEFCLRADVENFLEAAKRFQKNAPPTT